MIFQEGNTYLLEIPLTVAGESIDIDSVSLVEFAFNDIKKLYDGASEEVTYDSSEKCFKVPLSQEETFALKNKLPIRYQARVKFQDGSVKATLIYQSYMLESISKEVL